MTSKRLICCLAVVVALAGWRAVHSAEETKLADVAAPMISHDVYFTLKDNTADTRQKLVEACKKYLTHHPGAVFFAAGIRDKDFNREVNDKDWDVGLHVVFKNKAAHDQYQESSRHQQFIKENKDNWATVRVFDTQYEP